MLCNSENLTSVICLHTVYIPNGSILPLDRTLSGSTTQSGPESDSNEGVFHISPSSKTGASPSGCLMSYSRHLLREKESYLLQWCSWCILQPASGLKLYLWKSHLEKNNVSLSSSVMFFCHLSVTSVFPTLFWHEIVYPHFQNFYFTFWCKL